MRYEPYVKYVGTGACIALGIILGSALLAGGLRDIRRADRYVTVKGLVEREVMADLAVWTLKVKSAGNDLPLTQKELEDSVQKIKNFLKVNGLKDNEVELRGLRVVDRKAQEYNEARADQMRYIVEATVFVRSVNVPIVIKVSQLTSDLVKNGVALAEENACNSGPAYLFTKLNDIKPEMIAEATKNARASAEQFALDSGSSVGGIRQANQGVFSVTPRDAVGEEGGGCGVSDAAKRIRVVTTVDYYLEG